MASSHIGKFFTEEATHILAGPVVVLLGWLQQHGQWVWEGLLFALTLPMGQGQGFHRATHRACMFWC